MNKTFLQRNAACIWCSAGPESPDQYLIFRKIFTLPAENPDEVQLDIAADSTYEIRINGKRCPGSQLADMPGDWTFSSYDISSFVRPGKNVIAVEVHYLGEDFLTYRPGPAFLCAALHAGDRLIAATDSRWKWAYSQEMQSGLHCRLTSQLGFVFCRDERRKQPWDTLDFDDSAWKNAVVLENVSGWHFSPRAVPQLTELPCPDVSLVQAGYLKRNREEDTFALSAFHDYLTLRRPNEFFAVLDESQLLDGMFRTGMKIRGAGDFEFKFNPLPRGENADGYYLIVDLGREKVGFLKLDITAPAGTVVDICHGEHLDDGRVRTAVGGRNFADRLICAGGRNQLIYTHRRIGGRYIELHITRTAGGEVGLHYAGLIPLELPLPPASGFVSEDRLLAKINEVSEDTLKLCMHEHYEDCPWREQGLYAYDSRNQILYGYHVWGNYDYAAASLDLLGKSFDGERYLKLTSPGNHELNIPIFTLVWITELYEYYLYSGSTALAKKWLPQVNHILDKALSEPVPGWPGLYHPGDGEQIINFCEWNGRLSRLDTHPQAPYNIYLYETLNSAAKLNNALGNHERAILLRRKAAELGKAVAAAFYNSERGSYEPCTGMDPKEEGYEHLQVVMLANDLVPAEKRDRLLDLLQSGTLRGIDLSALYYLTAALLKQGPEGRRLLTDYLREILEPVVLSGATSLWETRHGGNDFGYAGSLCHGWSAIMPYFCRHVLLGVTPLEPGFRKFEVRPYAADLSHAAGSIPTPHGFIRVEWQKCTDGLRVKVRHPAGLECIGAQWEENSVREWDVAPL